MTEEQLDYEALDDLDLDDLELDEDEDAFCPECGAEMDPDETVCPQCGAEYGFYCPECDEEMPADATVCPHCGAELDEGFEDDEDADEVRGRRRRVRLLLPRVRRGDP